MPRSSIAYGRRANLFLRSLSPQDAMLLSPRLTRIECGCGETLATGGADRALVYFPEDILVGLEISPRNSAVALIGREGLVGWGGLLGLASGDYRARVFMGGGSSLAIPVGRMREACFVSPTLTLSLLSFVQGFTMQMSWSLFSARRESLSERICGLLLMIHDRIERDEIPATHRALAAHLGVRRASITDALHILEGERAVRNERGRIFVRNRSLIERFAGSSYGAAAVHYRRHIGPSATSRELDNELALDCEAPRNRPSINTPADRPAGFA